MARNSSNVAVDFSSRTTSSIAYPGDRTLPRRQRSVVFDQPEPILRSTSPSPPSSALRKRLSLPSIIRRQSMSEDSAKTPRKLFSLSIRSPTKLRSPPRWSDGCSDPCDGVSNRTPHRPIIRPPPGPISIRKEPPTLPEAYSASPMEGYTSSHSTSTLIESEQKSVRSVSPRSPSPRISPVSTPPISRSGLRRGLSLTTNLSSSNLMALPEDHAISHTGSPGLSHDASSSISPVSPAQSIWLCSPPSRSPSSPSPAAVTTRCPLVPRTQSESSINSMASSVTLSGPGNALHRPFTTRSISTGRFAHEFDEDGSMLCLSGHSERIVHGNRSTAVGDHACTKGLPARQPLRTSQGRDASPAPTEATTHPGSRATKMTRPILKSSRVEAWQKSENHISAPRQQSQKVNLVEQKIGNILPRKKERPSFRARLSTSPNVGKIRQLLGVA